MKILYIILAATLFLVLPVAGPKLLIRDNNEVDKILADCAKREVLYQLDNPFQKAFLRFGGLTVTAAKGDVVKVREYTVLGLTVAEYTILCNQETRGFYNL